jgi:hypothetical protein
MASQEYRDALFIASDNRANFKQIIAKRSDLAKSAGGRLAYSAVAAGTFATTYAGTVLGYATTGADAGKYKPYAAGNTDGSQVAVAILAEDVLTDSSGNGSECSVLRGKGITLFQAALIGLDAGAITALGAVSYVEHGTTLLDI